LRRKSLNSIALTNTSLTDRMFPRNPDAKVDVRPMLLTTVVAIWHPQFITLLEVCIDGIEFGGSSIVSKTFTLLTTCRLFSTIRTNGVSTHWYINACYFGAVFLFMTFI